MDRYLKGRVPTLEVLKLLCSVYNVSADWLLGLPERGGSATARGTGSVAVVGSNATVSTGGDCSRCQLMAAHIREITGRG